jgi:polyribonucleotide nucleotidyltransferase
LDTKIDGIPSDVLAAALQQAKEARLKILDVMTAAIAAPRETVAESAPKIVTITIPLDKVGEVIGPKGKVINTIQQETGASIAVDDDGSVGIVTIGSPDASKVEDAKTRILNIVDPPTAELGATYTGRVVNIAQFGAFVNILPGRDGLIHISKLGNGERVARVEDVVNLGDEVTVRVDDIDDRGKVSLSLIGPDGQPMAGSGGGGGGGDRRDRGDRNDRGGNDRGGRDRDRGGRGGNDRGGRDRDRGGRDSRNDRGGNDRSRGGRDSRNDRGGNDRRDSRRDDRPTSDRPPSDRGSEPVAVSFEDEFNADFNG